MRNIVTLGGRAVAFGVLGADSDAGTVRKMLDDYGVGHAMVLADPARRTTRKQRILAGGQQLLRIDMEDTFPLDAELGRLLCDSLISVIRGHEVDAVLFEDYGKGVLSSGLVREVVAAARRENIITALDPKPGNLEPVEGITVMKPNRLEAYGLSGLPDGAPLGNVAAEIQRRWNLDQLVISLAAQGLALFRQGCEPVVIPTQAREVFDVSGAGDTLIGTYTLALASGAAPETAAAVANFAAGVVVGKVGTVTVTREELLQAIDRGE